MFLVSVFRLYCFKYILSPILFTGAGIYAISSDAEIPSRPIGNNGVIVSSIDGLQLECISNSSQTGVGSITTPAGTIRNQISSVWVVTNEFNRPGFLRLQTHQSSPPLPHTEQGIYTCTIPDSNGRNLSLNVGLYPHGFNS